MSAWMYNEKEKATYLLQEFCNQIKCYLQHGNTAELNMDLLKESLKSYEMTLPDFCFLRKLKERIIQIELVLRRGSKEDIQKMLTFLQQIYTSINSDDAQSFERYFSDMIKFLEENQAKRSEILELRIIYPH
jgi:hypothetical protein